jgi:amino acid adenylation domain-containing protein
MNETQNSAARREVYTPNPPIDRMISMHAARHPNAPAVILGRERMSYYEMNRRANLLARYLRSVGVGRESIVALWLRRSPWIMVAALAAFKAQAAYLPLDPEHPSDRLLFTVNDSGAKIILTDSVLAERTAGARCRVAVLDRICDEVVKYDPEDLELEAGPQDLAYVIYTSGSTGTPKGVEITHANLANLVAWHNRAFSVTAADRASHLAGLGFDASVWETWPYLTAGASLCLADYHTLINPERLRDWIVDSQITIGFVPTPMAERLLALEWPAETRLRTLLTGGDTLHVYPPADLPFTVVNNYGPTECTVVSTSCVVPWGSSGSLPPIGMPIDDTDVHILDGRMQRVSSGKPGELYIGGANVGRGYRNHPELTAARFVQSPFAPDERLFKTGDLGYYLPNGQIAFLGRTDNQVKIRGNRIELEEIAAVLNSHPGVIASTVALHGSTDADKQLIGYVVAQQKPSVRSLQGFLAARLPDYMIPSVFVRLQTLPLTANGKVDRTALPPPTAANVLVEPRTAPGSDTEIRLTILLSGLLKVSEIGVDDDFFMLGGHSLLGTQLIARIRDSFQVELPLLTLFDQPTVRGLAAEIDRHLYLNHASAA